MERPRSSLRPPMCGPISSISGSRLWARFERATKCRSATGSSMKIVFSRSLVVKIDWRLRWVSSDLDSSMHVASASQRESLSSMPYLASPARRSAIFHVDHRRDRLDLRQEVSRSRASGRRQMLHVSRGLPNILEAGGRPGVVLIEIVGRRFISMLFVDREAVASDDLVGEGVVLDHLVGSRRRSRFG